MLRRAQHAEREELRRATEQARRDARAQAQLAAVAAAEPVVATSFEELRQCSVLREELAKLRARRAAQERVVGVTSAPNMAMGSVELRQSHAELKQCNLRLHARHELAAQARRARCAEALLQDGVLVTMVAQGARAAASSLRAAAPSLRPFLHLRTIFIGFVSFAGFISTTTTSTTPSGFFFFTLKSGKYL